MDKFLKFIIHIDNLLKLLVLLLPCKKSDLSIRTLRLVHIVPQQSHTNLSVCSVLFVNYLVSQFELFIHMFGLFRYQHWGQIFLSSKVFCCIDQLIPQSQKLVEICLSYCKILDQSELFLVIFPEYFVLHPSSWNRFWTKKIVQICLDICQSPHSRYKLTCPRKQ